jgi:hypothetical protein
MGAMQRTDRASSMRFIYRDRGCDAGLIMTENSRDATQQQTEAGRRYASLLDEAMGRINCVDAAVTGRLGLSPALVREFSYLQIRMLCEVVSLGCLVAHGDIAETQSGALQKEWSANRIINRLGSLHPNFYPHPIRLTFAPGHVHFDRVESGFLTKAELLRLYRKCGSILHRASLENLVPNANERHSPDFTDVVEWTNKIIKLLDQHHIASVDNLSHFICMLKNEDTGGRAGVALALSPLPLPE